MSRDSVDAWTPLIKRGEAVADGRELDSLQYTVIIFSPSLSDLSTSRVTRASPALHPAFTETKCLPVLNVFVLDKLPEYSDLILDKVQGLCSGIRTSCLCIPNLSGKKCLCPGPSFWMTRLGTWRPSAWTFGDNPQKITCGCSDALRLGRIAWVSDESPG